MIPLNPAADAPPTQVPPQGIGSLSMGENGLTINPPTYASHVGPLGSFGSFPHDQNQLLMTNSFGTFDPNALSPLGSMASMMASGTPSASVASFGG